MLLDNPTFASVRPIHSRCGIGAKYDFLYSAAVVVNAVDYLRDAQHAMAYAHHHLQRVPVPDFHLVSDAQDETA